MAQEGIGLPRAGGWCLLGLMIRTVPTETEGMPTGIPHIIGNEAAERFSFYGMKAVLAIFMARYLHFMTSDGGGAMSEVEATEKVHLFNVAVYLTPVLGAILADVFWGKYRTIITLSMVYVAGHAALAFMGVTGEARWWLYGGLALIALGSGGVKPCVSAHVGDQFGAKNAHLLPRIFNWFYFSINVGAMLSTILTPWLLEWYGPHWAFGVPGVLMALATLIFWLGRKRFVHVPADKQSFLRELNSPEGWAILLKIAPLYLFVAMFWALFDQTGSTWIFQAEEMDRNLFGTEWLPSQIHSLNSVFVLSFIPLFTYLVYPGISRVWRLTSLRKIGLGLFLMVGSFGVVALIQEAIDAGGRPSVAWQVLAYALLTASEVMVSIVALEWAYTQGPKRMKSVVMCFCLGAVALGNLVTVGINVFIQIDEPEFVEGRNAGFDGVAGTEDDLRKEDGEVVLTAGSGFEIGVAEIAEAVELDGKFPKDGSFSGLDPWGKGFRYELLNSRTARLSSDGPDGEPKTKWDVGVVLTLAEEKKVRESSWMDGLRPEAPWLEQRKAELGLGENVKLNEAGLPFTVETYAGGGTKLEGAAYFWFFTGLMAATAVAFIPYARRYQEKLVLQG